jgi:hypothetical protein
MTNQYHAAELLELGTAKALVLGNKVPDASTDQLSGQFGTRVIDDLSDEE